MFPVSFPQKPAQWVRSLAVRLVKTWARPAGLLGPAGGEPVLWLPWAASPLAVLLSSRGVHSMAVGPWPRSPQCPQWGAPRKTLEKGAQAGRVGCRAETPAGHKGPQAPDPGTQPGVPCRASRQPGGMQGLEHPRTAGFRGSGVGQAEGDAERGRGPTGGLSGQHGRSESGARRGGVPTAGTPPGTLAGSGCPRGHPWGCTRVSQLCVFRCCSQPPLLTGASHTTCL